MAFGTGGLGAAAASGFTRPRAEPARRNSASGSARSRHRARAAMAAESLPFHSDRFNPNSSPSPAAVPSGREELDLLRLFLGFEKL